MSKRENDSKSQLLSKNIYEAVLKSKQELLKSLLVDAKFDDVNDKRLHLSALDLAVQRNDYTSTELLLDHGALPDYNLPPLNNRRPGGQMRLKDSIDIKSLLYESTYWQKFMYSYTWTKSTLNWAIMNSNYYIVKLLIERGCDPDAHPDTWYDVVRINNLPIFILLMEKTGRKVGNNLWCQEMMLTACGTGSNDIIFYLLDEGVPVDIQLHGQTGAFRALIAYKTHTFMQLVERGANLHFVDPNGLSLLHAAVFWSCQGSLQLLLDNGLDVNICDTYNRTPLHYAALQGDSRVLDLLINHGADINAADRFGQTPIMIAAGSAKGMKTIHYLLQQEKIDLFKKDNEGRTILHHLAHMRKDLDFDFDKNILFRPDIDVNVRDKSNRTPLQYAIEYLSITFIGVLLDFGARTNILPQYTEMFLNNKAFIRVLELQKMKRSIAGFDNDVNIDAVLGKQKTFDCLEMTLGNNGSKKFEKQIEIMKTTKLDDHLTYFDFLHAKKRDCIEIAKKLELRVEFFTKIREFHHYAYMLARNYINGLKPFTERGSKAIMFVEDNLAVISNYKLPSTVTYEIKKYLDIEDMVTINEMNLFESNDYMSV